MGPPFSSHFPALFLLSFALYLSRPTKFAPMGGDPCEHRSIGQAPLFGKVLPGTSFQCCKHVATSITDMLKKASPCDACIHEQECVWPYLVEQLMGTMNLRDIMTTGLQPNHCMGVERHLLRPLMSNNY